MEAQPPICTISHGNTTVHVRHLPFHVGSGPDMDLQTGSHLFAGHQFSLSTDISGKLHACVTDAFGLYVDGVYYPKGSPRVLLKSVSLVGTTKLQLTVTQLDCPVAIERPVGFLSEDLLTYLGFTWS